MLATQCARELSAQINVAVIVGQEVSGHYADGRALQPQRAGHCLEKPPDTLLKMALSAGQRLGLQSDLIPYTLQPLHEPPLHPMLFPLVKVRRTQLLIVRPPRQHHIDDGEDGRPERNEGAFLPPAGGNPFVLGCEIRVFRFGGDLGNCDEDLPQPQIPFARLAA